jgi:hypothetical protein
MVNQVTILKAIQVTILAGSLAIMGCSSFTAWSPLYQDAMVKPPLSMSMAGVAFQVTFGRSKNKGASATITMRNFTEGDIRYDFRGSFVTSGMARVPCDRKSAGFGTIEPGKGKKETVLFPDAGWGRVTLNLGAITTPDTMFTIPTLEYVPPENVEFIN